MPPRNGSTLGALRPLGSVRALVWVLAAGTLITGALARSMAADEGAAREAGSVRVDGATTEGAAGRGAPAADVGIDPPAPPGSAFPALAAERPTTVTMAEEILMTWLEPAGSGWRLRFSRRSADGWTAPVTIADGVALLAPGDRSSLTVIDTQAVRRTLIARSGDTVARSGDAGRTWSRLPAPPLPYASFAGGDEGAYAFWLAGDADGVARLLGTRVLAGETLLDGRALAGAATAAAMTWDGPVVAYRGRTEAGRARIAVVRRENARWTGPDTLYLDGPPRPGAAAGDAPRAEAERAALASDAMPASGVEPARAARLAGPSIAALRRQVAVAWRASDDEGARVLVAFSSDAARTFAAPVEVVERGGGLEADGPVAVALDEQGRALVLWTAAGTKGATLRLARVLADGSRGEPLVLAAGLGGEAAPRIVRAGERVAVAWTEGDPRRVRALEIPLAALPSPSGVTPVVPRTAAAAPRRKGRGRVGQIVPDLEIVSLDGEPVSLAALEGRAVLLNFWATWCIPCRTEMPELAALQKDYAPRGLVVVGVSVDTAEVVHRVRAFVAERQMPFAVWLDPEMRVYGALRVRALPSSFVIARDGRIVLRRDEPIEAGDEELRRVLERALG